MGPGATSETDWCGTTGTYQLNSLCSSCYTATFFGLDAPSLTPRTERSGVRPTR
ncbi:hypothetical protein ACFVT2_18700 [Streptomyces sp. NPDC058000]|uniref:hypothetical protein n=1 Tax=Streptomyces sp. NPDC058000 TaxID=3346299 RepID=UPI0036E58F40